MSTVYVNSNYYGYQLDSTHFNTLQEAWDQYPGGPDAEIEIQDSSDHTLDMNSLNQAMNAIDTLTIIGTNTFPDDYPTITISAVTFIPSVVTIEKVILDGQNTAPSFPANTFDSFSLVRSVVRRYDNPFLAGPQFKSNAIKCEYSLFNANGEVSNNPIFDITGTNGLQSTLVDHLVCRYCTFYENGGTGGIYDNAHSGAITSNEKSILPVFEHCIISNSSNASQSWLNATSATIANATGLYLNCDFNLLGTIDFPSGTRPATNIVETGDTFVISSPSQTSSPSSWQLDDTSLALAFVSNATSNVTFDSISNIITMSGSHSPNNGTRVKFVENGTLPAEISENEIYYVINARAGGNDEFQISLTENGAVFNFSSGSVAPNEVQMLSNVAQSGDIAGVRGDQTRDVGCWDANSVARVVNRPPQITADDEIYLVTGDTFDPPNDPSVSIYDPDTGPIVVGASQVILPTELPDVDPRYNDVWDTNSAVDNSSIVTFDDSTNTISFVGDAPPNNKGISFTAQGTMPMGLYSGIVYYIRDKSGSDFKLASEIGGAVVQFSDSGSGTIYGFAEPYTVEYTATDPRGTNVRREQIVHVYPKAYLYLDGTPVQQVIYGSNYNELGAYAIEGDGQRYKLQDGDIDSSTVDTNALGSYTVTYTYTSKNGVAATSITRTVEVIAAPTIAITPEPDRYGDTNLNIVSDHRYEEFGAVCSESRYTPLIEITYPDQQLLPDGTINPYYDSDWNINAIAPAGKVYTVHYFISIGTYTSYTITASAIRTVSALVNNLPEVYLNYDENYNTGAESTAPIKISSSREYDDPAATAYDYDDGVRVLPSDVKTVSPSGIELDFASMPFDIRDTVSATSTIALPQGFREIVLLDISSISTLAGDNLVTLNTTNPHNLTGGDDFIITDTVNFNGKYQVWNANSPNQITFYGSYNQFTDLVATENSVGLAHAGQFYWVRSTWGYNGLVQFNKTDPDIDYGDDVHFGDQGSGIHTLVQTNQYEYSRITLSPAFAEVNEIDLTAIGNLYRIEYDVPDTFNSANISTKYRYVQVIENPRPELTFVDRSVTLGNGDNLVVDQLVNTEFVEPVTALDPDDGDVSSSIRWSCSTSGYEYIKSNPDVPQILDTIGTFVVDYIVEDADVTELDALRESNYTLTVNVVGGLSLTLNGNPDDYIESQAYVEKGITISGGFSGSKTTYITLPSESVILPYTTANPNYDPAWDASSLTTGTYKITYVVIDAGNNAAEIERTVNVSADQLPLWTLNGDGIDNSATFTRGSQWRESGFSVIDDLDGDLTGVAVTVLPSDRYLPATHPNALQNNPYYDSAWSSSNLIQGSNSDKITRRNGLTYYEYTILYYVIDPTFGKYSYITRRVYVRSSIDFVIDFNGSSEIVNSVSENQPYVELGATAYTTNGTMPSDVLTESIEITIYDSEDLSTPLMPSYLQKNIKLGEFTIDIAVIDPTVANTYKIKYVVRSATGDSGEAYRTVVYNTGTIPNIRLL